MHVYTVGEGLGKGEIINTYILHARVTKTRCVIVAGQNEVCHSCGACYKQNLEWSCLVKKI